MNILSSFDEMDHNGYLVGLLVRCLGRNADITFRKSVTFESIILSKFLWKSHSK